MAKTKTIDPIDAHAGQQFRKRREEMGFSQAFMGESLSPKKTAQQIQKYESGFNRMGFSVLYQFSKMLKVTLDYFAEGLDEDNLGLLAGETKTTPLPEAKETRALMKHFTAIPNREMRTNILTLTRSTAKTFTKLKEEQNDE